MGLHRAVRLPVLTMQEVVDMIEALDDAEIYLTHNHAQFDNSGSAAARAVRFRELRIKLFRYSHPIPEDESVNGSQEGISSAPEVHGEVQEAPAEGTDNSIWSPGGPSWNTEL
jgi:hypothetical protein